MQSQGTTRTPLPQDSPERLKKAHNSSLRLGQSGLKTQTANQPKYIPP